MSALHEALRKKDNPKRILSLDGGGIRGILTLGMLQKIESIARLKSGNPQLVLGDYYDLICGTSTGAIIACGLATGMSVDKITELYLELGKEIFGKGRRHRLLKRNWTTMRALFKENYSSRNFEKYLQGVFKEVAIGDEQAIKCGLAINSKRADTYSLWTVANHPDGKYFEANRHLKLWELCRASSAAPYYFKPKKLHLMTRKNVPFDAAFIDGGVSLANNPAWVALLTAVTPSFGFNWTSGRHNILITTLGTGNGQTKEDPDKLEALKAIGWASKLSNLFMVDALEMNQVILEILGHNSGLQYPIDSQFEKLNELGLIAEKDKLFSFERHNVTLTCAGLEELGIQCDEKQADSYKEMDYHENMQDLLDIGRAYAVKKINDIL